MLFISSLMVAGMAWLINSSFQSGLQNYLNRGEEAKFQLIAERVMPYYSKQYGWQKLKPEVWHLILEGVFAQSTRGLKEPVKLVLTIKNV